MPHIIYMATERIIADSDFKRVVIRTHRLARNITMRVKPDGLYLTVPPFTQTNKILHTLREFRPRLLEQFRAVAVKPIDLDYSIRAECFKLSLTQGNSSFFTVRQADECMVIACPPHTDFSRPEVQKLLRGAIVRALKKRAEDYLPPLLATWSARYGLPYKKVRITTARTRWGSCTSARTISLSCYLMLVPARLMDYVMLHELAHTKEMNHGPAFWALLNSMTEGQALQLRAELRRLRTGI